MDYTSTDVNTVIGNVKYGNIYRLGETAERRLRNSLYERRTESNWANNIQFKTKLLRDLPNAWSTQAHININDVVYDLWDTSTTVSGTFDYVNLDLLSKKCGYRTGDADEHGTDIDTSGVEEFLNGIEVRQNR